MERVERVKGINEVYATIARVASHLSISENQATVLLLIYNWDEEKLESDLKLSPVNGALSVYFLANPVFDRQMTKCCLCGDFSNCPSLGCGHYVCLKCFKEHIESKIHEQVEYLICPKGDCGKFLSHSEVVRIMSEEAERRYEISLLQSFKKSWLANCQIGLGEKKKKK